MLNVYYTDMAEGYSPTTVETTTDNIKVTTAITSKPTTTPSILYTTSVEASTTISHNISTAPSSTVEGKDHVEEGSAFEILVDHTTELGSGSDDDQNKIKRETSEGIYIYIYDYLSLYIY